MNSTSYHRAAQLSGDWARGLYPHPIPMYSINSLHVCVGIYFACRADGILLYVGSAVRPKSRYGIADRIHEHQMHRRGCWRLIWVLPLHDDTPAPTVHLIEGQIIDLFNPPQNRRRHIPAVMPRRGI